MVYVGVLPFAFYKNKLYLGLGQEKIRKGWKGSGLWSDFGGGLESSESRKQGAAREFFEESMGLFVGGPEEAYNKLSEKLSISGKGYTIYLLEVKFNSEASKLFRNFYKYMLNFGKSDVRVCELRVRGDQINLRKPGYFEKTRFEWFTIEQVDSLKIFRPEFSKTWPKLKAKLLELYD